MRPELRANADEWKASGNGYRVGWELTTRAQRATVAGTAAKIVVQVEGPAVTLLRKGFFSGAECGGDIAR